MLLDGEVLREAPLEHTLAALWAMTLGCAFLMLALRERAAIWGRTAQAKWRESSFHLARASQIHDLVWLGTTFTVAILPLVIFWQVGQQLFNGGFWLPSGYILWSATGASLLVLARNFAEESAERRKALAQFARRVSHEVMDELLSHPEEEYPRTRRVVASVLFADLEGFTTYSENHEPEEVVDVLNELFGRLEPIVYEHGGTVDKYIGDAIMAFFGAPLPRFDHAARALSCAVAMQETVREFRDETGTNFHLRVGVHTGDVIVGCVGSRERSDYTVIGDTVNLASRLEGKNKEFDSWILCSSETIAAAPGVVWADAARTQIKGKAHEVDIYIVRGMKNEPPCDTRWGHQLDGNESEHMAELGSTLPQLAAPQNQTETAIRHTME
jgi:class 3 adenylate cyclase